MIKKHEFEFCYIRWKDKVENKKLKAIILEDNLSTSWDYEMILDELGVQVQGVYKSWKKVISVIKSDLPDFMIVDLFLDHNERGLDFIEEMKDFFVPTIICSAYAEKEFMDDALDAGIVAFLSKPIDKPSLTYQVKKVIKDIKDKKFASQCLTVKDKRSLVKIPFREIVRLEIEGNYSFIFLRSGKRYIKKISLVKLMEQLDAKKFIRCHRSTIVNVEYIVSLDIHSSSLNLIDQVVVPIGANYKSKVKKEFTNK